jgi:hypothetical protein
VPSKAGHLISVTTSFGLGLFIKIVSEIKKDTQANFTGTRSTRFISLCKIEVVRPSSQLMVTPLQVFLLYQDRLSLLPNEHGHLL